MSTTPQEPPDQPVAREPGLAEPGKPTPASVTAVPAPPEGSSPSLGLGAPPTSLRPHPAWLLPALAAAAGLVLGVPLGVGLTLGIQAIRSHSAASSLLTDAVDTCGLASTAGIDLGDEGRSITFDMKGEEDLTGADITDLACLFAALDMPSSISSHIDQTTSMDGRQSETWDAITVSWSYHPDRGLDGVLTVAEK